MIVLKGPRMWTSRVKRINNRFVLKSNYFINQSVQADSSILLKVLLKTKLHNFIISAYAVSSLNFFHAIWLLHHVVFERPPVDKSKRQCRIGCFVYQTVNNPEKWQSIN